MAPIDGSAGNRPATSRQQFLGEIDLVVCEMKVSKHMAQLRAWIDAALPIRLMSRLHVRPAVGATEHNILDRGSMRRRALPLQILKRPRSDD